MEAQAESKVQSRSPVLRQRAQGFWRYGWLLIPLLALVTVTVPHLGQGDFRRDTGRYAAVGHHMWTGGHLLRPYLDPQTPYFNKPPMALLIHGFFLKTFGRDLAVARVPSILAALGVVFFTVLIAKRLSTRAEAVTSGLILALTYEFWRRTREISLDFWQLFFMMAAVYFVVRAVRKTRAAADGVSDNSTDSLTPSLFLAAGVPLGCALLCKPLMALLILPVLCMWMVFMRSRRGIAWLLLGTLPVALLVALPWHAYMYSCFGPAFVRQYFGHEVIDRARGLLMREPVYFYAVTIAATYWPWFLALGWGLYCRFGRNAPHRPAGRDLMVLGGAWSIFFLFALTLFPDKKPNYALPVYPALAWMSAAGLCRLRWAAFGRWYRSGLKWLAPSLAVLLLVLSVAPIQFQKPPSKDWANIFKWIDSHGGAARLCQEGLPPNEHCYYYIRRGQWVPVYSSTAVPGEGPIYILAASKDGEPPPNFPDTIYQSGRVAIRQIR